MCGIFKGVYYRICYGLTKDSKMDYSKELYEFSKDCKCEYCKRRLKYERGGSNHISITTDSKEKFKEVVEILNNYTCNNDKQEKIQYLKI